MLKGIIRQAGVVAQDTVSQEAPTRLTQFLSRPQRTRRRMIHSARLPLQMRLQSVLFSKVRLKRFRIFPQVMPESRQFAPILCAKLGSKLGREVGHVL